MIAALKATHISALAVWCAGLLLLPVLLHLHGRGAAVASQDGFARFRRLSHYSYTRIISPAAVIAVAAGTMLILVLDLVTPWMLTKLAAVAGMVLVHAWMGHLISQTGEQPRSYRMPPPLIGLVLVIPLMLVVLWLVLAKPDLAPLVEGLPDWLRSPQDRELPPGLTPI